MPRMVMQFWRIGLLLWSVTAVSLVVAGALVMAADGRLTDASFRNLVIAGALTGAATALITITLIDRPMVTILSRINRMIEGDFGGRIQGGVTGGILSRIMRALDDLAGTEERRRATTGAAERRYRTLYEQNPAGLVRTRSDGRIVDCNMAAVRMLGYESVVDATTRNVVTYYADPADRTDVLARVGQGETICNLPLRVLRKDGREITVLLTAAQVEVLGDSFVDGVIVEAATRRL